MNNWLGLAVKGFALLVLVGYGHAMAQGSNQLSWSAPREIASGVSDNASFSVASSFGDSVDFELGEVPSGVTISPNGGCAYLPGSQAIIRVSRTDGSFACALRMTNNRAIAADYFLPQVANIPITATATVTIEGRTVRLLGAPPSLPTLLVGSDPPVQVQTGSSIRLPVRLSRLATEAVRVDFESTNTAVLRNGFCMISLNEQSCSADLVAAAAGAVTVKASSSAAEGTVAFPVAVLPLPPPNVRLRIVNGERQRAVVGARFDQALEIEASSVEGVPQENLSISFRSVGPPSIAGLLGLTQESQVAAGVNCTTNADGRCRVWARAGVLGGRWTVSASVASSFVSFDLENIDDGSVLSVVGGSPGPEQRVATVGKAFFNNGGQLILSVGRPSVSITRSILGNASALVVSPDGCVTDAQGQCTFTVRAGQIAASANLRFQAVGFSNLELLLETVSPVSFVSPAGGAVLPATAPISITLQRADSSQVSFPAVRASNVGSTSPLAAEASCTPQGAGTQRNCNLGLDLRAGLVVGNYPVRLDLTLPGFPAESVTRDVTLLVDQPPPLPLNLQILAPENDRQFTVGDLFQPRADIRRDGTPVLGVTLTFSANPPQCVTFPQGASCQSGQEGSCTVSATAAAVCPNYTLSVSAPGATSPLPRSLRNVENSLTLEVVTPVSSLAPSRIGDLVVKVKRGNSDVPGQFFGVQFNPPGIVTVSPSDCTSDAGGQCTFRITGRQIGSATASFQLRNGNSFGPTTIVVEVSNRARIGRSEESQEIIDLLTDAAAPNAQAVDRIALAAASSLGSLCASSQATAAGSLRDTCDALIRRAEVVSGQADARAAMRAIAGEEARNLSDAAFSSSQDRSQLLQQRLAAIRGGGGRGFSADSLSMASGSVSMSVGQLADLGRALMGEQADSPEGATATSGSPWGSFVSGSYVRSNVGSIGATRAYDLVSYNLMTGIDYRPEQGFVYGVALGLSRGDLDYGRVDGAGQDGQSSSLSFYASRSLASAGLFEAAVSLARHRIDYAREVNLASIDQGSFVNLADVDAEEFGFQMNFSYPLSAFGVQLTPELGLVGSAISFDRFVERDRARDAANIWLLEVPDHEYSSLQSRLAVRVDRSFTLQDQSVLSVNGSLQGYYELLGGRGSVIPTFARLSNAVAPAFELNERSNSYGVVDFGISWRSRQGLSLQLTSGTYLGLEKTDRFYLNVGGSYSF